MPAITKALMYARLSSSSSTGTGLYKKARLAATRLNYYGPKLILTVNGTVRTRNFDHDTWAVTDRGQGQGRDEDCGGEALRLLAARLRGAVEHRFDSLILEQPGIHCGGDREAVLFEGGGGGLDDRHRVGGSGTHVFWIPVRDGG